MSNNAATIRAARVDDIAVLADIEGKSFSDPWPQSAFRDVLQMPSARLTVAVDDTDVPLAYCVLIYAADQGEIANIAVAEAAKRRGLGSQLLTDTLAFAAAHGLTSLFLEVRESNVAARALYEQQRFLQIGRRRGYYQRPPEDALVLQWQA